MKGEYLDEENELNNNNNNNTQNNNNNNNMFAKFSHHPKFQPPPQQHHFPPPHLHHPYTSQEADSAATTPPPSLKKPKTTLTTTPLHHSSIQATSNEDAGGTIEVSRRPRGRPPGSKNKPKPPIVITREPEPAMSPYILELSSGADVVESLTRFTRRRGVGLCVLTASGGVANVTLKQPSTTTPGGTVTFHGRFDILSLSAVVVANTVPFYGGGCGGGYTISLAGPQGQIVGGKVVGSLMCSGTVYVIAASFNNPSYCRLPLDEQENDNNNNSNQCHQQQLEHQPGNNSPVSGGGDGGGGGGTMSLYSGNLATPNTAGGGGGDVMWATGGGGGRPPY